jgi:hypothetical protein
MPWRHMGEWRYSSTILDLSSRWRWMVNFTSLPIYPRGKSLWYPLNRWLGGPQNRLTLRRREKSCTAENRTRAFQPLARRYNDWAIPTPVFGKIHTRNPGWALGFLESLLVKMATNILLVIIHSFINGSTTLLLGPGLLFSSVIFFTQTVGLLGRVIRPSQGLYLHTGQHKQNKRKHTQTSMPRVGF